MITVSFARSAVFQPWFQATWAIAEPSSCATLPKLKASLPALPNRFGAHLIGADARRDREQVVLDRDSCTTGEARSTSHVVKMIFAPC